MNKPTFRAWDEHEEEMLENIIPLFDADGAMIAIITDFQIIGSPGTSEIEIGSYDTTLNWDEFPYILMQSTGLKGYMDDAFNDPEEKEVYRGDVIDIFWEEYPAGYYQENHMIGVVDLDETGTAWIIKNGKYDWDNPTHIPNEIDGMSITRCLPDEEDLKEVFLHNFNLTSDDITILGNIHENPELLNEVSG